MRAKVNCIEIIFRVLFLGIYIIHINFIENGNNFQTDVFTIKEIMKIISTNQLRRKNLVHIDFLISISIPFKRIRFIIFYRSVVYCYLYVPRACEADKRAGYNYGRLFLYSIFIFLATPEYHHCGVLVVVADVVAVVVCRFL